MKKVLFSLPALFTFVGAYAQNDTIFLYSAEPIICKVIELSGESVGYKYEGEELVNKLSFFR